MATIGNDARRLRALIEAGTALSSELSLDALLQRLVEAAAELTDARYAALGVIDRSGTALERFITTGTTPEEHAAIGEWPRGLGVLGVLIKEAKPLLLEDLSEHELSVGFPPNHPPMRTFLGIPILLRGVAYGNLYLTEKLSAPRSPTRTRTSSRCSRRRPPWRSRMHDCTRPRRVGCGRWSR